MNNIDNLAAIETLRKEKNAVILAHFYQIPEIQDIADFVGDSLNLAQKAAETKADLIIFAGVHFMAETAKLLNPGKKVVLPDLEAGCSLADSCKGPDLAEFKKQYSDHIVISYINCSAEVKALSDLICTSSNALKLVESFPKDQKIIFAPDKNLGGYINRMTGRNMVLWNGTCQVHDILKAEKIINLKLQHPDAKMLAHPECNAAVLELADFIGSTTAILKYANSDSHQKYIVATETGIIHQMKKQNPEKEFIIAATDETCACNDCEFMKLNTVDKLYLALKNEQPEIILNPEIMDKAKAPIVRMLEMSKELGII
jgi:quinolinate synthase